MARFTRRSFIQSTAVLGASSLVARSRAQGYAGADYDVVIIGAGISGMTAARLLGREGPGLKVLVLEAVGLQQKPPVVTGSYGIQSHDQINVLIGLH